jgi:hypothetical protein
MEVKVNESNLHLRAVRSCISWTTIAFQVGSPSVEAMLGCGARVGERGVEKRTRFGGAGLVYILRPARYGA